MKRALILLAAGAALAGCTLEPAYVRPTPKIPGGWPTGPAYPPLSDQALPSLSYTDVFKDAHLQAVIAQALANNQDLEVALANVDIARAQYRVQRAALFPTVAANASAGVGQSRNVQTTTAGAITSQRTTTRDYSLNVGVASWEIDLFGRIRSLTHAARQRYLASEAGVRAARLTLVGEVADAYLTLAADRSLLAVSQQTEASAGRTVELTRARLNGGVAPGTDLTQAETLLDQAKSDRAARTTQVAQDLNALQLLVGAVVADADLPASIEAVDGLIAEAPAGLDSRILLRRPDVAQAEYGLRAANAQIGAARAAFFPTISLTTLAGFASPALSSLFSGGSFTWEAQGAGSLPLFTGGANVGNLALARGEQRLAAAQYQQAIQAAFRDVADALARRGTMEDQLAAQNGLVTAANQSLTLSTARYREGIDPYLNTLDAQRTLYSARQTLASTRLTRAENLVALYQSLGGDQLVDDMPAPATGPKPKA